MALTDPQAVTISGVTSSLPRVSTRVNGSDYSSADGLIKLSLDHAYGRRIRRVLRLDHAKISPDLFLPSQNIKHSMSNYMVFDVPPAGYSNAEAKAVYDGFAALLLASSNAIVIKLLGGES